jgi:hypothetical protein
MRRLSIKKNFKNPASVFTIQLSESENGKPYLSVSSETSIGIPLTEKDAERMYLWLKEHLYPYSPGI